MGAEDLLGAVFPDQIACAENLTGEREIPDHPLVRQTIGDCLTDAMDLAGLKRLLARIQSGDIRIVACDLTEPSPLALEVLSARPLRVSRRRAARGTPHPGGYEPPLARA
jgi:ATP-dependent Lhr-like helicase